MPHRMSAGDAPARDSLTRFFPTDPDLRELAEERGRGSSVERELAEVYERPPALHARSMRDRPLFEGRVAVTITCARGLRGGAAGSGSSSPKNAGQMSESASNESPETTDTILTRAATPPTNRSAADHPSPENAAPGGSGAAMYSDDSPAWMCTATFQVRLRFCSPCLPIRSEPVRLIFKPRNFANA